MMRMVNNGVMMSDQEALVPLVETVIHHRGAQGSSHARARTPNTRIMPCAAGLALLVSSALLALSAAGALLGIPPFSFFHSLISTPLPPPHWSTPHPRPLPALATSQSAETGTAPFSTRLTQNRRISLAPPRRATCPIATFSYLILLHMSFCPGSISLSFIFNCISAPIAPCCTCKYQILLLLPK